MRLQVLILSYTILVHGVFDGYKIIHSNSINFNRDIETGLLEGISFHAYDQELNIVLKSVLPPIHKNIEITTSDSKLGYRDVVFDHYEGHLLGNRSQKVRLTELTPHVIVASINIGNDIIYVEPSDIHLKNTSVHDMLIFRESDVKKNPRFNLKDVLFKKNFKNKVGVSHYYNPLLYYRRRKRKISDYAPVKENRCMVRLVADYEFFSVVGGGLRRRTTNYILSIMSKVNEVFQNTDWDKDNEEMEKEVSYRGRYINLGMAIKSLHIITKPVGLLNHYGNTNITWNDSLLLTSFTKIEGSVEYCLVHLFTGKKLTDDRVLGLAYVGRRELPFTGICAQNQREGEPPSNTLFTVGVKGGTPFVSREAELVAMHEYGHSWGADHDFDDKYIMNENTEFGLDPKNDEFSNTSVDMIRNLLRVRLSRCFKEETFYRCGNGILDEGEQCDDGRGNQSSKCCTWDCKLHKGAVCSPNNHMCCTSQCTYHNAGHICQNQTNWDCRDESRCTGTTGDCPSPPILKDGVKCYDDRECRAGVCTPFCELLNLISCLCEGTDACKRCCKRPGGVCRVYEKERYLSEGERCILGYCRENKCISEDDTGINYYQHSLNDPQKLVDILKANIVFIIVIISLIIWIPCAVIVSKDDARKEQNRTATQRALERVRVAPSNRSTPCYQHEYKPM